MNVDVFRLKQDIIEAGEIAAMAMAKFMYPAFDELTYTQACEVVEDRKWVDRHVAAGNLHRHRRCDTRNNAKIYFSRMEIYALKKAESMAKEATFVTRD